LGGRVEGSEAIVDIDAKGCQAEIVDTIRERCADDALAVKEPIVEDD
jgi:predicted transposase YbfD/YdcC